MIKKKIRCQVAKEFNVNEKLVQDIYNEFFKYIATKMSTISKDGVGSDELTDFNIPYFGRLVVHKNFRK